MSLEDRVNSLEILVDILMKRILKFSKTLDANHHHIMNSINNLADKMDGIHK